MLDSETIKLRGRVIIKNTAKRIASMLLAICFILSMSVTAFAATFTDVPESHWGSAAVERAVENSLVSGIGNGQYAPDKSVTNAEWSQMLANLFWPDMSPAGGKWWFAAVRYTHDMGWLDGTDLINAGLDYSQGVNPFNVKIAESAITRYDMAQVIYNIGSDYLKVTVNTTGISARIADYQSVPTRYRAAVEYCYAAGFINGTDAAGTFAGRDAMTRAAAATVLCKLFDAKNGDWDVPNFDKPGEVTPMNTAVKDMVSWASTERNGFDYEVTVSNTTNAGKLSNGKDITNANIAAMLNELEAIFPAGYNWGDGGRATVGTSWGGDCYYYRGSTAPHGGGCNAWAGMTFDVLFGTKVKAVSNANLYDAKPGDLIEWKYSNGVAQHWIVVTGVENVTTSRFINGKVEYFDDVKITYCDGNANAKVAWGTQLTVAAMLSMYPNSILYSAY